MTSNETTIFGMLGTGIVTTVTTYWLCQHQQSLALFDRRKKVYDAVLVFLSELTTDFEFPHEALQKYRRDTDECQYVFSSRITRLRNELSRNALLMKATKRHLRKAVAEKNQREINRQGDKELEWMEWIQAAEREWDRLTNRAMNFSATAVWLEICGSAWTAVKAATATNCCRLSGKIAELLPAAPAFLDSPRSKIDMIFRRKP